MKKLLFILLLIGFAVVAYWYIQPKAKRTVTLVAPERGNIEAVIRVTGEVINDRTVTMTALVDGQITKMAVQKGDAVEAKQVLTVLDKREADARLRKARAELQREKQAVEETTRKLKRLQTMSRTGGAAKQAVDDANAEQRAAQARLKVAEAVLQIELIQREKVEVTAPFAGVITEKTTEVGQWVEAGTELFTLVAHEGREIEVLIDAGDSAVVITGQSVSLSSDAWPDRNWSESIARISPAISKSDDQALNTFAARITLSDKAPSLLLGQQVDARIHTDSRTDVLTLPFDALIENGSETHVALISDGKVNLRPIKTGLEDFTHVEVVEGLSGDEQVVLIEGKTFFDGETVTVLNR